MRSFDADYAVRDEHARWTNEDVTNVLTYGLYMNWRSERGMIAAAEARFERLNEEGPMSPKAQHDRVLKATHAFYEAFNGLNQVMALQAALAVEHQPQLVKAEDVADAFGTLLADGVAQLRHCAEHLTHLIDNRLEEVEFSVTREVVLQQLEKIIQKDPRSISDRESDS